MSRWSFVVAAAALTLLPAPAMAWGKTGHRAVAALAEPRLSGLARAQIKQIMGDESLVEAAYMPDTKRADPSDFWKNQSPPWHYVTLNGILYDHAPSQGDALSAIARFAATLKDPKASRADKQVAIEFIVHLVADLHQPMHAGKCCDKGGNDVEVSWFGKPSNLHSVWDSAIVDDQGYSYSELVAQLENHIGTADELAWWDVNPRDWVTESAQLRDQLYPAPSGKKPAELSYDYAYRWTPLANRRLEMAGVRLAAYLNAIFAEPVTAPTR